MSTELEWDTEETRLVRTHWEHIKHRVSNLVIHDLWCSDEDPADRAWSYEGKQECRQWARPEEIDLLDGNINLRRGPIEPSVFVPVPYCLGYCSFVI